MALTQIADLIQQDAYRADVLAESLRKSALYTNGAMTGNTAIAAQIGMEGSNLVNVDYFLDLGDTESVSVNDNPASVIDPHKIGTARQTGVIQYRAEAWSTADLTKQLSTTGDPMNAIVSRVGAYWGRSYDRRVLKVADGILADNVANDAGDMIASVYSDVAAPPAGTQMSIDAIIQAKETIGDYGEDMGVMVCHSRQYYALEREGYVDQVFDDQGNLLYSQAAGMRIVVSDSCRVTAGTNSNAYLAYCFAPGAFVFEQGAPKVPDEVQREALQGMGGGVETLVSRRTCVIHPKGFTWTGPADPLVGPTNDDLALATSWDRVDERKRVKFAFIETN